MQNDLVSISKIFTESLYRIPDYQRGYSWGMRQLKEFWADLEQLDQGKNHYTGVLTLEAVAESEYNQWEDDLWIIKSKRYSPYFVVDGQQRLTTIVVFLQCVIERLAENEEVNYTGKNDIRKKFVFESKDGGISRSYIFGYQKDNPSAEFLKTDIFKEASEKHRPPEDTIYTNNLQVAKEYFSEKLKGMALAEVEIFYTKVTQQLLFNIYAMADDVDVFVAFETMNNRGKPLSHLEILKNRLIYISTLFSADFDEKTKLRAVVNDCWAAAYNYLGKNKERPLVDNHFLLAHFYLSFAESIIDKVDIDRLNRQIWHYQRDDGYKDYLLNEVFNVKNLRPAADGSPPLLTLKDVYEYAHDLKSTVKTYYEISNPGDSKYTTDEKVWLERLRRISGPEPTLLELALFLSEKKKDTRIKLLVLFERLLFLKSISPYIRSLESVNLTELAMKVKSGKESALQAIEYFEKLLTTILKEFDFKNALREWVRRNGYYGWNGVKYFYFEYEEYLKSLSKTGRDKLIWSEFLQENYDHDYTTIEHIYPQKAITDEWKNAFGSYSVKERNILRNSLGNLIPLSRPKNASLGRKNFSDKKNNVDDSVGYSYGCYSENELALEETWAAKQIVLRGVRMLTFMEMRWGVSLGNNKEKVSILGLEFCYPKEKGLAAEVNKLVF